LDEVIAEIYKAGSFILAFLSKLLYPTLVEKWLDRFAVISLSEEEQGRLITPKRLELIRTLRDRGELTVSQLAELLDRRLDTISRDLKALAKHGIVEFKREGRTKRVRLATDIILLYVATPQEPVAAGGRRLWGSNTETNCNQKGMLR